MDQLSDFQAVCEQAARKAGGVLKDLLGRVEVREKGPADLVTEADFAAQEMVRQTVLGAFPHHSLLGEEGPRSNAARTEYRWVVDPLDGTTNYVHKIPFFCTSLALERNGELLVGAIFNPISGECFTAAKGQGAYFNGQRLHVSQVRELSGAVACAGFPAAATRQAPDVKVFLEALAVCQSMRRTGSAALNLAYLAAGWMDIFWSFSTKIWDVAAGILMIREAGGVVSGPHGDPFVLDRGHFLAAATEPLHRQICDLVARALALPDEPPDGP